MPDLIIDLDQSQQATALKVDVLLHQKQMKELLSRVRETVERTIVFKEQLNTQKEAITYARHHDVITVHGKRGSGKTTFLLSLLTDLQDKDKDVCVLGILDPTLFGMREHLLLTVLGKIAYKVRNHAKSQGSTLCTSAADDCALESWEKYLRKLAKGLKDIGETRDDLSPHESRKDLWEDAEYLMEQRMDSAMQEFGLERQFHIFLNESLKILGKEAFVLALDDIDTRPTIGWHVLEVLRKYFTSPQLVVILSGDMDLFATIIRKQQMAVFGLTFTSDKTVIGQFNTRIDGLTEQFLLKILRANTRISLGSFQTALREWNEDTLSISKKTIGREKLALNDVLKRLYEVLACHTAMEQKLFCQALFANPCRTVIQAFDALVTYEGEELAARLREIFFISLQAIGFQQPFELAEALRTTHGVSLLMEQLFTHTYGQQSFDLLPNRNDISENNALLTLQTTLTQVMQANPGLSFAYAFKACLLHEMWQTTEEYIQRSQYTKLVSHLALEIDEPLHRTASRIAALRWDTVSSAQSTIRNMGSIRLYASSILRKASTAVEAMYGFSKISSSEIKFCPEPLQSFYKTIPARNYKYSRSWINTPETLNSMITSWQQHVTNLGIVEVGKGKDNFRLISVFPLLALMGDILISDSESISDLLQNANQIQNIPLFAQTTLSHPMTPPRPVPEESFDDENEEDENTSYSDTLENKKNHIEQQIIKELQYWSSSNRDNIWSLPATLNARIMRRFMVALAQIDEKLTNQDTFVGIYLHRCLVAFFNSVLVEEFFLSKKENISPRNVLLEAPVSTDNIFLKNLTSTQAITDHNINEKYPLFKTIFTYPLWGLYLAPSDEEKNQKTSIFSLYLHHQNQPNIYSTTYGQGDVSFPNLFHILNSLAIPKPKLRNRYMPTARGLEIGISPNDRIPRFSTIINDLVNRRHPVINHYKDKEEIPPEFYSIFNSLMREYYEDKNIFRGEKRAHRFWGLLKKKIENKKLD